MRATFALAAGLLTAVHITAAMAEPKLADKATLDTTLQGFVDDGRVEGVSALVYHNGEEAYFGAFGNADREEGRPMARDTLVRIYSMTKPVTGVALMTLYEEGKFKLDDQIAKYAPEFADLKVYEGDDEDGNPILVEPNRAPTIRDFTRHTAGLGDEYTPGYVGDRIRALKPLDFDNSLPEFARRLGQAPLAYHPGTEWHYGMAVDVQAFLVERLSGKPFDQYVREKILKPLGMKDTGYFVEPARRNRMAVIYEAQADGPLKRSSLDDHGQQINLTYAKLTPGGFGLVSTLDDYMRLAQMLVHGGELDGVRILKPETVKLMRTDHLPGDIPMDKRHFLPGKGQVGFGIDFAVRIAEPANDQENYGKVGEFFWDGYASTLFWVDPASDLTAVMFVQKVPFDGTLHKDFRDAVYGVTERGHHKAD